MGSELWMPCKYDPTTFLSLCLKRDFLQTVYKTTKQGPLWGLNVDVGGALDESRQTLLKGSQCIPFLTSPTDVGCTTRVFDHPQYFSDVQTSHQVSENVEPCVGCDIRTTSLGGRFLYDTLDMTRTSIVWVTLARPI